MKAPYFLVLVNLFFFFSCQKSDKESIPQLTINPTNLIVSGNTGGIDSFTITYTGNWTLLINPSATTWLKPSVTLGHGNTKVYLIVQESNITAADRTTTIVVIPEGNGAQGVNITVIQKPYEFIPWRNVYGGTESDEFSNAVPAPGGGYVAVGSTISNNGDVSLNHGKKDVWVIKVDVEGKKLWQKAYGGSENDNGNAITTTPDGGYLIAGRTSSNDGDVTNYHGGEDVWLIKIDGNGNKVWQKTYGGSGYEQGFSIIATTDGGYIVGAVATSHNGDVSGIHGQDDAWLFKINASGDMLWQRAYGGSNSEMAISVINSSDGGFVAVGYSDAYKADGDVGVTNGSLDIWVFKVDRNGSLQWQKIFGGGDVDFARSITATIDGGYIVSGYTMSPNGGDITGQHGGLDGWILKIDASGGKQWQKTLGGALTDEIFSVVQNTNGDYLVAGTTSSTNGDVNSQHGLSDAWIIKLKNNGAILWQKTYGGTETDGATSIMATGSNTYFVTGAAKSSDGDVIGQHGKEDAWLIRFTDQ